MMNLILSTLLVATIPAAPAILAGEPRLPAMAAQSDPADSVWRSGRRAISNEEWSAAIAAFRRVRSSFPKSSYVGDSYYWEAFALYQRGSRSSLADAVALLDTQRAQYATSATYKSGESRSLATRIRGQLARNGDEAAAASIAQSAAEAARAGVAIGATAAAEAARELSATARSGRSSAGRRGSSNVPAGCPSEDEDDRVAALNALLQMRSDDALPLLKQVLARRDACSEILRRKAVFLVSQKRGSEAADILLNAAKTDPDNEVREQAVFWLGQVDSEKSVEVLEDILKTSKDENLQDKALFALSQVRAGRGSQILRDYAQRDDAPEHLREQAIFWLGQRRGDDNAKFLRDLFPKVKAQALQEKIIFALSQNGGDNTDFLVSVASNKANSMEMRKNALFWAGQSRQVDVARLAAIYDKGDEVELREQVIFVLSQRSRDAAAVDKLIEIAKTDKNRDLRQKAIFWLGQSRDPKAIKALQDLILRNPE